MKVHEHIEKALRIADWNLFRKLRYSAAPEGSVFYIQDLDLSNLDLRGVPSQFLCFYNCNLENANFKGAHFFPFALWQCNAKGLDISDTDGMLFAFQSDLRGIKYENTNLFPSNTDLPSAFEQCKMDRDFAEEVQRQKALLLFPAKRNIPFYAYGVPGNSKSDVEQDFLQGKLTPDDIRAYESKRSA